MLATESSVTVGILANTTNSGVVLRSMDSTG